MQEINRKEYIQNLEFKNLYNGIMSMYGEIKSDLIFSVDNLKTFSVTAQPNFALWLSGLAFYGLGNAVRQNATEELFGSEKGEGNHWMLCLDFFQQAGQFKIEHYTRCYPALKKMYSLLSKDGINKLYAAMCCAELFDFFFDEAEKCLASLGVKNHIYVSAHREADNHEEGHGIKMINYLVQEKFMTVDEFNQGILIWKEFLLTIFSYSNEERND
eukprot:gene11541-14135_t